MGHEELKEIGINAYGHRHKILKSVKERITNMGLGQDSLKYSIEKLAAQKLGLHIEVSVITVGILHRYNF
jgi:hypothetical protein